MRKITNQTNADRLWSIFGDFDVQVLPVSSELENIQETGVIKQRAVAQDQEYRLYMERSRDKDGVSAQKSLFVNISDRSLCISQLLQRSKRPSGNLKKTERFGRRRIAGS